MHTADFNGSAAIWFAGSAGNALPAIEIRDKRDSFAVAETGCAFKISDVFRQFVAKHTGIIKIWLGAFIRMKIGTANANLFYTQHYMFLFGRRLFSLLEIQFPGFYT